MDSDDAFPAVSKALLAALNERFPVQCPNLSDTERMVWFKAGQRQVVDFLFEQLRRQEASILEG